MASRLPYMFRSTTNTHSSCGFAFYSDTDCFELRVQLRISLGFWSLYIIYIVVSWNFRSYCFRITYVVSMLRDHGCRCVTFSCESCSLVQKKKMGHVDADRKCSKDPKKFRDTNKRNSHEKRHRNVERAAGMFDIDRTCWSNAALCWRLSCNPSSVFSWAIIIRMCSCPRAGIQGVVLQWRVRILALSGGDPTQVAGFLPPTSRTWRWLVTVWCHHSFHLHIREMHPQLDLYS